VFEIIEYNKTTSNLSVGVLGSLGLLFAGKGRGPALADLLGLRVDHQGAGGDVAEHGGAGAHVGAVAHGDGRDELGVRAHEDASAERRVKLVLPVVVAGDGARADVAGLADGDVAEVGQVVGLHPGGQRGLLELDEVAHVGNFVQPRGRRRAPRKIR